MIPHVEIRFTSLFFVILEIFGAFNTIPVQLIHGGGNVDDAMECGGPDLTRSLELLVDMRS